MGQMTDSQFDLAESRGREMLATEPRAKSAHYDKETGCVVINLMNGCGYSFPAQLVQDLHGASDEDLALVEVDGIGFNLHWPRLEADLFVPALLSGLFGSRAWMSKELARRAGQAKSPAKAAAARTNGAKGGRPRKVAGA